jgi:hypothetical protein
MSALDATVMTQYKTHHHSITASQRSTASQQLSIRPNRNDNRQQSARQHTKHAEIATRRMRNVSTDNEASHTEKLKKLCSF